MITTSRRTSTKRKRGPASRVRRTSPLPRDAEIARLRRELDEALAQQEATSEVLRVISRSPGELEPAFQTMLENATRICEAKFGFLWLAERDGFRAVAFHRDMIK